MGQSLIAKQAIVEEIYQVAAKSTALVGADYSGLSVVEMESLRGAARQADVFLKVIKNNLLVRAVEGTDFECIRDSVKGPLVMAFSRGEPGAAARIIRDFSKKNNNLEVQFLVLGNQMLAASDLDRVAKLPTKDEAISRLMGLIKAPISKLVGTLAAPHSKLVRTLLAVKNSKQE